MIQKGDGDRDGPLCSARVFSSWVRIGQSYEFRVIDYEARIMKHESRITT